MAFSDSLAGPWKILNKEIINIQQSGLSTKKGKDTKISELEKYNKPTETIALLSQINFKKNRTKISSNNPHIASPEIIIDNDNKNIYLFFHGIIEGTIQKTKMASSKNGIIFDTINKSLTAPYLKIEKVKNQYYGIAMPDLFYRLTGNFESYETREKWLLDSKTRHSDLMVDKNILYLIYTRIGNKPESILYRKIDIDSKDWNDWKAGPEKKLLVPELEWEGANQSKEESEKGSPGELVNQLRDPSVFKDNDGKIYLLYCGGGENGIGISELKIKTTKQKQYER
ncbi:MAG: hypothetical protein ACKVJS_05505 [Flavobacteriales bacterium]|jgi:type I site-specific restriction endonuclease|tara:strand:+ start:1505 stop:2356 length:852 start_codon:yes stop_codon:yes gene_type:complete